MISLLRHYKSKWGNEPDHVLLQLSAYNKYIRLRNNSTGHQQLGTSIELKWIEGYNQRQQQLLQTQTAERYPAPALRAQNKKNKSRLTFLPTDSINKKEAMKSESQGNNLLSKKLLMDSLKNEILKYVSRHKADSIHK